MVERVARYPGRLCSRAGNICCYAYRRLEYDFMFLCLASFFFPSFSPSLFGYVSLRIASVQQSSAPRQQVQCVLVSFVFCLIAQLIIPFVYLFHIFSHFLFLVGVFVVLSYPVRSHLICLL